MIFGNKRRIVGLVLAACLAYTAEFDVLAATPQSEAQATDVVLYEVQAEASETAHDELAAMASMAVRTQEWQGKALANTDTKDNIYTEMSESSKVAGIMYDNTVLTISEVGAEWTKVTSGKITGYVRNEKMLTGSAAVERANVTCKNGMGEARSAEEVNIEKLLAALIFCEAGNQPYDGKVAVGAVVMNRVESRRFPNNIKAVIYQRGQFTPAMTGKLDRIMNSGAIPSSCYDAARDALSGISPVGDALFFNTGHGSFKLGDHYFS